MWTSVHAEKDLLTERMKTAENERDRLRMQLDKLHENLITWVANAVAAEAKNSELEEALS